MNRTEAAQFGVDYHERSVSRLQKQLGFSHMSAKTPACDAGWRDHRGFQKNVPRTILAHLAGVTKGKPVEIWFQDEARIGQKNGIVRQWARRGTRPRQGADQRYENAYLFGAIGPARGVGAAPALPFVDTEAMPLQIDEIAFHVAKGTPCRAAARPRRLAHHRQSVLAEKHRADPAAVALAGTQPRRAGLAVPARQLFDPGF
jgi:hypothetical protein